MVTHAACAKLVTPALTTFWFGRIVAVSSVLIQLGLVDLAGYIAAAVDFMTFHDAGFIIGQCLTIDGGWCMT